MSSLNRFINFNRNIIKYKCHKNIPCKLIAIKWRERNWMSNLVCFSILPMHKCFCPFTIAISTYVSEKQLTPRGICEIVLRYHFMPIYNHFYLFSIPNVPYILDPDDEILCVAKSVEPQTYFPYYSHFTLRKLFTNGMRYFSCEFT